jgi:hypothetical protein
MAVAIVQQQLAATAASSTTNVLTVATTKYTAGNFVVVLAMLGSLTVTSTVTDSTGSNSWAQVAGSPWSANATLRLHAWKSLLTADIPIGGTVTLTGSATTHMAMVVIELSGSDNTIVAGTAVPISAVTAATVLDPPSVSVANADGIAFTGFAGVGSPTLATTSTNYLNQQQISSATTIRTIDWQSRLNPDTPTEDPDNAARWTGSSTQFVMNTFSVGAATAALGPVKRPRMIKIPHLGYRHMSRANFSR